MVFSTALYLLGTKNIKQVRDTFLQDVQKQISSTQLVSMASEPGGRSLIMERGPALVSQEGRLFIFIFNMDILYFWSMHPFLNSESRCIMYV